MTVAFYCRTCPFATADPREAFRHRSTEDIAFMANQHHVTPLTREEAFQRGLEPPWDSRRGIDRHFALEGISA